MTCPQASPDATLLRGARLPTGVLADIAIARGRIAAIGPDLAAGGFADAPVLDMSGLIVTPGGVDPHAHIEQRSGMGLWNADSFETATLSAAMGGTTSVLSFAAQAKGERLRDVVADYAARARRGAMIDHAFHLSLSDPDAPGFEDDLRALIAAGHRSVKVFTTYDIALDQRQIEAILAITGPAGALTCVHAEDDAILRAARDALVAQGKTRPIHHAEARPKEAERVAVARLCEAAQRLGAPVMIFHVSCAEAADEVRRARAAGAPVTAETCPHYLFQTAEVLDRPGIEGAKWMCSPPQRDSADQQALRAALADGTIALISSDHAPYRLDETGKLAAGPNPPFPRIANGMPGLETRGPLVFDAFGPGGFARFAAEAPAAIHGLRGKGRLAIGADADITCWDPDRTRVYGAADLHDNAGYNPYEGRSVTGWPVHVFLRGARIVTDGKPTATPGQGRWIDRRLP